MSEAKFDSLEALKNLLTEEQVEVIEERERAQREFAAKDFHFQRMIARKNELWLHHDKKKAAWKPAEMDERVFNKVSELFNDEKSRRWVIHLIYEFMPLSSAQQVPKMPVNRKCPFTGFELTGLQNILTGDRDKHIAYVGKTTDVMLSGIGLQELYRLVRKCSQDFNSKNGRVVNYVLDSIRTESLEKQAD